MRARHTISRHARWCRWHRKSARSSSCLRGKLRCPCTHPARSISHCTARALAAQCLCVTHDGLFGALAGSRKSLRTGASTTRSSTNKRAPSASSQVYGTRAAASRRRRASPGALAARRSSCGRCRSPCAMCHALVPCAELYVADAYRACARLVAWLDLTRCCTRALRARTRVDSLVLACLSRSTSLLPHLALFSHGSRAH